MGGKRAKRFRVRHAALGLGALVLLLAGLTLGAQLYLRHRLDAAHLQRYLEAALTRQTHGLYHVRIGAARFSYLGRSFELADFELYPDTAAFRREGAIRTVPRTRYHVRVGSLRFHGIPMWPVFGKQFVAALTTLDSLRIEISLDKTGSKNPASETHLPQEYLLGVRQPVRLNRLEIRHGYIRYSERAFDGARFGTLPFADLEAVVTNLSNGGRTGVLTGAVCQLDVRALLAGKGRLVAHFDYDLSSPKLNLAYRGSIARMDVRAFNSMLVDLQGMRVREGQLDTAWFAVLERYTK